MDAQEAFYDDQFKRYLLIGKGLVQRLRRSKDRKVSAHWIQRLISLTTCSANVGKDRNNFFQYFIRILQQAVLEDMLRDDPQHILQGFTHIPIQGMDKIEDPDWLENETSVPEMEQKSSEQDAPYFAHWSNDQRTYIATKALPGQGALIYMAVSTDPSLGWTNLAE